ncbi:MAG TPA: hypothetical protein VLX58_22000 [Bryobacteraceae bacterium]|nr:hypothetical protein [Bryobacteraceae bacterium]
MFGTLSEQMKRDEQASRSFLERSLEWAGVLAISLTVFAVLYFVIVLLE